MRYWSSVRKCILINKILAELSAQIVDRNETEVLRNGNDYDKKRSPTFSNLSLDNEVFEASI